jgi:hypothetical protein
MQLRNSNNEVLMQFSTITNNNGEVLFKEKDGELVSVKGIVFTDPFSQTTPFERYITINGGGICFKDSEANATTINNNVQTSDVDLSLPNTTGQIQSI